MALRPGPSAPAGEAHDLDDPAPDPAAGGGCRGCRPREVAEDPARNRPGAHRDGPGARPGLAERGACPGAGAPARAAARHLFVRGGDELARIPIQSASDRAVGGGLRRLHDRRDRHRVALSAGAGVAGGILVGRHRFAAGRGGPALHRAQTGAPQAHFGHPRRRRAGQRCDRADPVSLRGSRGQRRRIFVR